MNVMKKNAKNFSLPQNKYFDRGRHHFVQEVSGAAKHTVHQNMSPDGNNVFLGGKKISLLYKFLLTLYMCHL